MKNTAIYAGTFDPITLGHLDILKRAAALFDRIIIAVAASPSKQPLFTLEERIALAQAAVSEYLHLEVKGFKGLLIDFAKAQGANVLLRGLRNVTDFDYEYPMASMNRELNPKIESLFLIPSDEYRSISASLVREIATLGGDITNFVPSVVAQALKNKITT